MMLQTGPDMNKVNPFTRFTRGFKLNKATIRHLLAQLGLTEPKAVGSWLSLHPWSPSGQRLGVRQNNQLGLGWLRVRARICRAFCWFHIGGYFQ